jgi:hypothetical protein
MLIKRKELHMIIDSYVNEVFGYQRFVRSGNSRVDAFKDDLRKELTKYYKVSNDASAELLGTVNENVGNILKTVWMKHVDTAFINSVVKIHYMRMSKFDNFFKNSNNNIHEISTVGYLPGELPASGISVVRNRGAIAVRLKGDVVLASNENMNSGRIGQGDIEKYGDSGVPKFADHADTITNVNQHIGSLISSVFTLQSQLERLTRFIILDRSSHMTNEERGVGASELQKILRGNYSDHNEYILDNWYVDAIVDISNFKEMNPGEYAHLQIYSESRGIPILSLEEATQ